MHLDEVLRCSGIWCCILYPWHLTTEIFFSIKKLQICESAIVCLKLNYNLSNWSSRIWSYHFNFMICNEWNWDSLCISNQWIWDSLCISNQWYWIRIFKFEITFDSIWRVFIWESSRAEICREHVNIYLTFCTTSFCH